MINAGKSKSAIYTLAVLLFTIPLLISCGGGGGGGGSSSGGGGGGSSSGGVGVGGVDPFILSVIDSTGDVGLYSSITTGSIHMVYYDNDNFNLKYASAASESGPWTINDTIDSSGHDVGSFFPSIVLDSSGDAHIAFYDLDTLLLKYATNATGSWVVEDNLDSSGDDVGMYASLAIDSVGAGENIHISYYDYNSGEIKYVTGTAGSWGAPDPFDNIGTSITLDTTLISLAIDSSGKVHIAYYDDDTADLKYTNNIANTLTNNITTIDSTGVVGTDVSLALGPSNNSVHISYYDVTNENLQYAACTSSCEIASNWSTESIDSTDTVGDYTSISVDSDNNVHISYHDITNGNLKYATGTSGSFTKVVVDNSTSVGDYSSISVDATRVHISYYDSNNMDLKYATRAK